MILTGGVVVSSLDPLFVGPGDVHVSDGRHCSHVF